MNVQGPGPKLSGFLDSIGKGLAAAVSAYAANTAKTSGLKAGVEDSYHSASSSNNIGNVLATVRSSARPVDNLANLQGFLKAAASPNRTILAA